MLAAGVRHPLDFVVAPGWAVHLPYGTASGGRGSVGRLAPSWRTVAIPADLTAEARMKPQIALGKEYRNAPPWSPRASMSAGRTSVLPSSTAVPSVASSPPNRALAACTTDWSGTALDAQSLRLPVAIIGSCTSALPPTVPVRLRQCALRRRFRRSPARSVANLDAKPAASTCLLGVMRTGLPRSSSCAAQIHSPRSPAHPA